MDYITNIFQDCFSTELTLSACIWRMLLSMLLGCAVGFERKRKGQTAGIRTFALISMGATLAMLVSIYVPQELMGDVDGDPTRIAAQVVSGIGFLGAGAIIQMKACTRTDHGCRHMDGSHDRIGSRMRPIRHIGSGYIDDSVHTHIT